MATPRRTLRHILARRFVLISIATLLLQLAYTTYQYGQTSSDLITTALESDISKLTAAANAAPAPLVLPADLASRYEKYPESYGFEILDSAKSVVASANAEIFSDLAPSSTESGESTSIRDAVGGQNRIFESRTVGAGTSSILVRVAAIGDPANLQMAALVKEIIDHVTLPIVPLTIFLFIAIWIALDRSLAPVEAAAKSVQAVADAEGSVRLDLSDAPMEIAALGTAVNTLLDRLEHELKAHHDFAANVAHELRTPLALLTLDLEASSDVVAKRALDDVHSMSRLVEQLLSFARLEGLDRRMFTEVDLGGVARATAARLAPGALKSQVEIEVVEAAKVSVTGHAEAIESALRNLMENAIRVAPRNSLVTIMVGPERRLEVKDRGPGIAPERLAKLFDRFAQGDQDTSGKAGLGLDITRRTMELHGGKLEAASEPGMGSSFTLVFPD